MASICQTCQTNRQDGPCGDLHRSRVRNMRVLTTPMTCCVPPPQTWPLLLLAFFYLSLIVQLQRLQRGTLLQGKRQQVSTTLDIDSKPLVNVRGHHSGLANQETRPKLLGAGVSATRYQSPGSLLGRQRQKQLQIH